MATYAAKFFEPLDEIIVSDVTFERFSRVCWRDYGPLNVIASNTRFCKADWPFAVLYASETYATAFCETLIRDEFNKKIERKIPYKELEGRDRALLMTSAPLALIDLRGDNFQRFGIPPAVIRNTDHRSGRAFSYALHQHREDVDGILYPSRLEDGGVCVAIYDRAFSKLYEEVSHPLLRLKETAVLLERFRVSIDPENG